MRGRLTMIAAAGVLASWLGAAPAAAQTKSAELRVLTKTSDVKATKLGSKGEEYPLVDSTSIGSDKAALTMIRAKGKVTVKKHGHTSTEILIVLSGKLTVGGESRADSVSVGEGAGAWVPAGRAHALNVEGSSGSPAAVLVFHAPGSSLTDKPPPVLTREWAAVKELPIAGGKGTVKILFDKDSGGDGSAYAGWLKLGQGAAVPEHVHASEAEVLWIVKGQGEMTVAGQKMTVTQGMSVAIPAGTKHSFTASEDVEAVQFYAPGGPEQRFKPTEVKPAPTPAPQPAPVKPAGGTTK